MKILKNAELLSENEFSKHFKYEGIEVYINKAFDDETNKHYFIASIPKIEKLDVSHINYPFSFDTEEERDAEFKDFNELSVVIFLEEIIKFIEEQQEKQKNEDTR